MADGLVVSIPLCTALALCPLLRGYQGQRGFSSNENSPVNLSHMVSLEQLASFSKWINECVAWSCLLAISNSSDDSPSSIQTMDECRHLLSACVIMEAPLGVACAICQSLHLDPKKRATLFYVHEAVQPGWILFEWATGLLSADIQDTISNLPLSHWQPMISSYHQYHIQSGQLAMISLLKHFTAELVQVAHAAGVDSKTLDCLILWFVHPKSVFSVLSSALQLVSDDQVFQIKTDLGFSRRLQHDKTSNMVEQLVQPFKNLMEARNSLVTELAKVMVGAYPSHEADLPVLQEMERSQSCP